MQQNVELNFAALKQIFNITDSRDMFYDLAEKGVELPKPMRKENGYRFWTADKLPAIAKRYSDIPANNGRTPIINFYVTKGGGSHKTTDAFTFASFLGIFGRRVLVIDLDFQINITRKLGIDNSIGSIRATGEYYRGMYEVLNDAIDCKIEDAIVETRMPNVSLIPASVNLVKLEAWLIGQPKREQILSKTLESIRDHYDAIVIDNNPSWSQLSSSSLFACDLNVASIGLDANTQEALPQFFETMEMTGTMPKDLMLAQGFYEKTALKKQIQETIKRIYPDNVSQAFIRKSTAVDEANMFDLPVFLYKPKENASEDYLQLCEEIWTRAVTTTSHDLPSIKQ